MRPSVVRTAAAVCLALLGSTAAGGSVTAQETGTPPLFRVHASPGLEGTAERLATDPLVQGELPGIGPPAAVLLRPVDLWVVGDLREVPGDRGSPADVPWVAGFADPGRNLVAVRAGEAGPGRLPALRRTFRHELAHLALHRATGGNAPRWLHEGYAQYAAGDWNWSQAWRLRFLLLRSGGDLLRRLSLGFNGSREDARAAYLLSYTAVQALAERGGGAALRSFFDRLRAGATVDGAVRDVYGVTLGQFERSWKEQVTDRYGWLYLLSRASLFWVALTVALLVLGFRRWRYDRRRWQEMRERERRDGVPDVRPGWDPRAEPWKGSQDREGPRTSGSRDAEAPRDRVDDA